MVRGNQYVRSKTWPTERPWDEWENKDFKPIIWQSGNALLNTLQNGLMKWEPSTVQNRRLRPIDTSIEDCPCDNDAIWYERDCEVPPAEERACITHWNCGKKNVLRLFRLHSHLFLCLFTHTNKEQSSVSLHLEGFSSKFVLSRFTRHFSLEQKSVFG